MPESVVSLTPNPLHVVHEEAGAEFQAYDETEIVATFGQPQVEYAAIRKGAALVDLPQRGLLELTGKDRLPFLNNLLTNQIFDKANKIGLTAGQGVYAFLLNAKSGRVVADVNVIERGDRTLLELDARLLPMVKSALEKYLFAEQVKLNDTAGKWCQLALHGPQAATVLEAAGSISLAGLKLNASIAMEIFGRQAIVWRDDPTGAPGYYLIVSTDAVVAVWNGLTAQTNTPRVRPTGWAAFNAARIEGGRALFGIDFDDTILAAETSQINRAVSFTKGCYPGQEIVARMHARQQVAKQIVGLKFADDALPIAGAPVMDDQSNTVGGITSSTVSPMLSNTAIALALVKRPFVPIGTVVNVPAEGQIRKAVVTQIPFIKETP